MSRTRSGTVLEPLLRQIGDDDAPISEPDQVAGPPTRRVRAMLLLNVFAASLYLAWWLVPGRTGTPALFWALAVAEAFSFAHLAGLWWTVWCTRVIRAPARRVGFTADVFVTTCGEPVEVIEATVRAAVAMRHPHRTIVCDDGRDPRVRLLADRLGAEYVTRDDRTGAKAGNLNNALRTSDAELVAVFDADHIPRRDFLVRLLGYFTDGRLGFVQTPQHYRNAPRNAIARGALDQQAIFYGPICRGKNGLNAAFCCGTNVVFRRAALDDVGGFDERSVVEDLVTSMRMHRRGWRSLYHPWVLASGLGPDTIGAYLRQQFRWARGSVGALVDGEPFRRGYRPAQRLQYLLASTYYLTAFATAIYVSLPFLYAFGGWSAFSTRSSSFAFFYAPYLVLSMATIRWGLGRNLALHHLRFTFGAFPAYLAAGIAAFARIPARFRVTGRSGASRIPVSAMVTVAASAMNVAAIGGAFLLRPVDARTITTVSWAVVNLALLSQITWLTLRALAGRLVPAGRRGELPDVLTGVPVLPDRIGGTTARLRPAAAGVGRTVAALTVAGLGLRVALIGTQSLRLDEALSLRQAGMGLRDLWAYLATSNVHVPLYHSILHLWTTVAGTSEVAARVPSVVLGTLAIPLLFAVARRLAGTRTALVAAAIGAGSPFWVWHSDEARMYPLFLVAVLASTLLFLRACQAPRAGRWLLYGAATGVALYSHYFAMLLPPIHALYLVSVRSPRRVVAGWLGGSLVAAALFAPWAITLWLERLGPEGVTSISNNVRLAPVTSSFFGLLYGMVAFVAVFLVGYHGVPVLTTLTALVGGMWPFALVKGSTRGTPEPGSRRTTWFLVAWVVLAVGTVFALNTVMPGLLVQKYLILASPPLFILAARAIARAVGANRSALAIGFALLAATAIVQDAQPLNPLREDFRRAASIVRTAGVAGEHVFVLPRYNGTPFAYYHDGPFEAVLAPGQPPRDVVGLFERYATEHRGATFWTVSLYAETADPAGVVARYLTRSFDRLAAYKLGARLRVVRYRIPPVA